MRMEALSLNITPPSTSAAAPVWVAAAQSQRPFEPEAAEPPHRMSTGRFDIVIVGAGHAGARCAQAARKTNPDLSILLIGDEDHPPYERPPLSMLDSTRVEKCFRPEPEYYSQHNIELLLGTPVINIARNEQTISLADGRVVEFGKLVLATGSRPRQLPFTPASKRIHYLRTLDDATALSEGLARAKRIAIIGAGFIGLEVAAAAGKMGRDVVVLEREAEVLTRALPADIAAVVRAGVSFRFGSRVLALDDVGDQISVTTEEEGHLVDLVLVGIGVMPNTGLASQSGLTVRDGIVVDSSGRTSDPNILAAGEVTSHPVRGLKRLARRESWQVAELQGAIVGQVAAGAHAEFNELPWFCSDQGSLYIQIVGSIDQENDWVFRHNSNPRSLCAFSIEAQRIRGCCYPNFRARYSDCPAVNCRTGGDRSGQARRPSFLFTQPASIAMSKSAAMGHCRR